MNRVTRRDMLKVSAAAALAFNVEAISPAKAQYTTTSPIASGTRPAPADRRFRSEAVERFIVDTKPFIADPELARLFSNCFPNTLDTTVEPGMFEGKPDTAVITGDIAAMWLRDSSAQV